MNLKNTLVVAVGLTFGASLANASGISYTCDASVAASTCNYLNTVIAGQYDSIFINANADIYITYGSTGLGQSTTGFYNFVTYAAYVGALTTNTNQDALQASALAALNTYDATPYGSDYVDVTSALAQALGLTQNATGGSILGTTFGGTACTTPGSGGCYNGIITVTNDSSILYYDDQGGTEGSGQYDFYGVVEHETDEVLGTSSCISTQDSSGLLTDPCDAAAANSQTGNPSAVDLYRYNSAASLALNNSYIGLASASGTPYFSYNGGTTNGSVGTGGLPKYYNTLANGDDYSDFVASSPDCRTNQAVQDGTGCPGESAGLNILNDGGSEIEILNAVGFDEVVAPEPGTIALFGFGCAGLLAYRRRA